MIQGVCNSIGPSRIRGVSSSIAPVGGGAPSPYDPGYEYQRITPATVYGKFTLAADETSLYPGGEVEIDATSGMPNVGSLTSSLETLFGSDNVEVELDDDDCPQIKYVGDLAEYDIPAPSVTPSDEFPPNNGSDGTPTLDSVIDYEPGISAEFTVARAGSTGFVTVFSSVHTGGVPTVIPMAASESDAKSLLNVGTAYNGTVDSVVMTPTSMRVVFTQPNGHGNPTIGGKTGASVTVEIETLQNGANPLPSGWSPLDIPSCEFWGDPRNTYIDDGITPAPDGEPVLRIDDLSANGTHDFQLTLGKRPIKVTHGGKPRLLYDGISAESFADVAAYQTSTVVIVYEYVTVGAGTYRIVLSYGKDEAGAGLGATIWFGQTPGGSQVVDNNHNSTERNNGPLDTAQHTVVTERTPTTFKAIFDGVATGDVATSGTQTAGLLTGAYRDGSVLPANAYVGDRLVFSSILSPETMTQLLDFLADR